MSYKKFSSNFSKHELINSKGLTFRGAFVAVIALHFIGAGIFCGYVKYQSYRHQIAKQEYKTRLQQKDLNKTDWNNNNLKLRVVAVPSSKLVTKNTTESKSNYKQLIKNFTDFTLNCLAEVWVSVNTAIAFVDRQFSDRPKKPHKPQTSLAQNKPKQTQSTNKQQKETAWKVAADNYQVKHIQTKKPEPSEAEKRLAKALDYDKKKARTKTVAITLPPSVVRSIPPIKTNPSNNTRPVSSNYITERQIINSNQINSPLNYTSEIDQQTNEVVHTFYSY